MAHVTFIHGIGNKPTSDRTLTIWRRNLAIDYGIDLGTEGITSSMAYWADILYEEPSPLSAAHESVETVIDRADADVVLPQLPELPPEEAAWVEGMRSRLGFDADVDLDEAPAEEDIGVDFERIPLPGWLKKRLMRAFLRDVHHYLFDTEHTPRPGGETYHVRQAVRQRLLDALVEGAQNGSPHVIVAHSLGTVITYDLLKNVGECPPVDAVVTIGSPLGLDEVQDQLGETWSRENGYPDGMINGEWVNIYDSLDPVAGLDPQIADDFKWGGEQVIADVAQNNGGTWRHDAGKYFAARLFREHLSRILELEA